MKRAATNLLLGSLLLLGGWATSDGPDSPETAVYGYLAFVDATVSPATIESGIINGTDAYLVVRVPSADTYSLLNPAGLTVQVATSTNNRVFFESVNLSSTGLWKIKNLAGSQISQWDVVNYDGQPASLNTVVKIILMTVSQFTGCGNGCMGPFDVQDFLFNSSSTNKCSPSGPTYGDISRTATLDILYRGAFVSQVTVEQVGATYQAMVDHDHVFDTQGFETGSGSFVSRASEINIYPPTTTVTDDPLRSYIFFLVDRPGEHFSARIRSGCAEDLAHFLGASGGQTFTSHYLFNVSG